MLTETANGPTSEGISGTHVSSASVIGAEPFSCQIDDMKPTRLPAWLITVNIMLAMLLLGLFMAAEQQDSETLRSYLPFGMSGYIAWSAVTPLYYVLKKSR